MYKIIPKRACTSNQRITKNYFLSILPSYPDTQYVIDAETGEKIRIDSIKNIKDPLKVKNGFYTNKYIPIETAYPRKILYYLKTSDWKITSFNSKTREICFSINDKKFSYLIPNYVA